MNTPSTKELDGLVMQAIGKGGGRKKRKRKKEREI